MAFDSRAGSGPPSTPIIRTLGTAGLYTGGKPDPLLGPGKPLALLIYLALAPGRRVSREFLLDLLWADLEPERARGALRQVLFHLRRLLGEAALPGTGELALALPVEIDRDHFLRLLDHGKLEAAIEAYAGPFLPDFGVPGGAAFEHWADLERDRLRAAFLRTAELVVRRLLDQSRFREAQRLARRARDEAPEAESGWRLVLETVVAAQDFVAAAVEAQALETWAAGGGRVLEPATREAIARARRVSPNVGRPEPDGALVAELTGREREFALIITAWEGARGGPARHLHLTAPAGLGKSRLLRDAAARLRAAGTCVAEVRATPGERDLPYALAGEVAAAIAALPGATGIAPASAAALVALNPALSSWLDAPADPATGEEALRRRIQALGDLVQAVADQQPWLLVIDDLHWGDAASLRVLDGLFGRLGRARVLCLTAARPERHPAAGSALRVELSPLTPEQVGSLVSGLGVVPDQATWAAGFVAGLSRATGGSPLLVLETLRLAMDEGTLTLESGEWRCGDPDRLGTLLRAGEALRYRVRALGPASGWLLALLATAGTPLALATLAASARRPEPEVAAELAGLERQGLATHLPEGWVAAHDEIADAARDLLTIADQAAADRAIGGALIRTATEDAQHLRRGIRHLVAAAEHGEAGEQFRRYLRQQRSRGDRRPPAQLARDILGGEAEPTRLAPLVGAVPPLWRMGLWNGVRQAMAAGVAVTIGLGAFGMTRLNEARAAALQHVVFLDAGREAHRIRVQDSEWDRREDPVALRRGRTDLTAAALAFPERPPYLSPDGRSVAWNQNAGDSTTIDIWLRTPEGTRRLTRQVRDDLVAGWLPDGSGLVGLTNRWSDPAVGGYDVAIFDTATGAARQITSGPAHEGSPAISPDGTRIAFIRQTPTALAQLCVVAFDALDEAECRSPAGQPAATLLGWINPAELLVTIDSGTAQPLGRYDWARETFTSVLSPAAYRPLLSPDRRWVVAGRRVEGVAGLRDWVIPLDRPARARPVGFDPAAGELLRWWEGLPPRSGVIDRIEFMDTSRVILPGVGTRLRVRALTASGTEVPIHAPVRWRSLDTLVASVEATGEVRPRAIGRVTIEASLAGWRSVSRELEVVGRPAEIVATEAWDGEWTHRWITFGTPHPEVVTGPEGRLAFWNRGDGSYPSIGILRRSFPARHGLGLELPIASPLSRRNWQRHTTLLTAGLDTAAYRGADQHAAPPSLGRTDAACGIRYPIGDGPVGMEHMAMLGGSTERLPLGSLAEPLSSGRWWTLRLQILPDGRCGVAINGTPVWLSRDPVHLDLDYWLILGSESAGGRLLHGPLEIWTGVRTDIDWSRSR